MPMGPSDTSCLSLLYTATSKINDLILDYYNNFRIRITSGSVTSDWQCLRTGIITGCAISVTFFSFSMKMVVKAAEVWGRNQRMSCIWNVCILECLFLNLSLYIRNFSAFYYHGTPQTICSHPPRHFSLLGVLQSPFLLCLQSLIIILIRDRFLS